MIEQNMTQAYAPVIANFLAQEFPGSVARKESVFEAVAAEIFGTKQHRYGPMPSPEMQVVVREVIRHYMDRGEPIEFLVPWGSSKQGEQELDVLELSALRNLHCLSERVKALYSPGIRTTIRIEDLTDYTLFGAAATGKIATYAFNLKSLASALNYTEIEAKPESSLMFRSDWNKYVEQFLPVFIDYIRATDRGGIEVADSTPSFGILKTYGWQGKIPFEQREYYREAYRIFYPGSSEDSLTVLMASYFACSLARVNLYGTGRPASGKFIQINYSLPVPGIPTNLASNRIMYRTVPERFTNRHKAPWIGQGYVEISNNNSCKIKLANFNERLDLIPYCFNVGAAKVQANFMTL